MEKKLKGSVVAGVFRCESLMGMVKNKNLTVLGF